MTATAETDTVTARLRRSVDALLAIDHPRELRQPGAFLRTGHLYHRLGADIAACATAGVPDDAIRAVLQPARSACSRSPFMRRTQDWPRGYPGDFETVEYLLAQINTAPENTLAWHLEAHSLGATIAQQHRNKVAYQAQLISETLDRGRHAEPRRILIIASGAAPDLRLVPAGLLEPGDVVVLNDVDHDALTHAKRRLGPTVKQCLFDCGNVFRSISRLAAHGPYDLVLAGGLFDYLDDRAARHVIHNAVTRLCKPGGTFYFSNISTANPHRWWTEYLVNWALNERDPRSLRALLAPVADDIDTVSITTDPTGLALLTTLRTRTTDTEHREQT